VAVLVLVLNLLVLLGAMALLLRGTAWVLRQAARLLSTTDAPRVSKAEVRRARRRVRALDFEQGAQPDELAAFRRRRTD
jgi:autotransporter translocation and assembly factor TamB